jgi:sarcosine oxidase subunit gamma
MAPDVTADPHRRTALTASAEALASIDAREVPLASQISVRVDAPGAAALGLPSEHNTWSRLDGREALWLGPDEWLVVSETDAADEVLRDLEPHPAGRRATVVDVSAARAVVELAGADRLDLLAAGCGLDLHPRVWRGGTCAQTLLANTAVLLQERHDATRVFVRPSFAGYLVSWLTLVAAAR